jgi:hypothetical protein
MDYKRIRPVRRNLWVGELGSRPNLIMDSEPGKRSNRQVPADSQHLPPGGFVLTAHLEMWGLVVLASPSTPVRARLLNE